MSWHIRGSYFESCNCDAICPCRRIDGVTDGRPTYGICEGALSWLVDEGECDGLDLAGTAVALSIRFDDDEPGSPWTWVLYLDDGASVEQHASLTAIFTGARGGDSHKHFPWASKPSELVAVRTVPFDVDHEPRRQRLRIGDYVNVTIRDRHHGAETVSCGIPGHDQPGEELVADVLAVEDEPLSFRYLECCGFGARFSYSG